MRQLIIILFMLAPSMTKAQTDRPAPEVIFFDDFNNNKNNWTIADNKHARSRIDSGFYYLTAKGHAYGATQEIKIDTRKDFEIETRIKIFSGNADHKNYYSMLFWGREAMNSYYFTFAKDGFASMEICDGKNQSDCITKSGCKKLYSVPGSLMCTLSGKQAKLILFLSTAGNFTKCLLLLSLVI